MSPRAQVMFLDQEGAVGEEVTVDQVGSPERLCFTLLVGSWGL